MTRLVPLAGIFYGALAGVAGLWLWLAGRAPWPPGGLAPGALLPALAAGASLGLALHVASHAIRGAPWMRELEGTFREAFGSLGQGEVLALALVSGIGEELLFRAALQPAVGLIPASLLFGLAHFPVRRELLPWSGLAALAGLALGALFDVCEGHVAAPIAAHAVVNAANLGMLREGR
ncbi:MAG: CPBP family glutamic-type intramembrane protease [Planctomycetales bacterium]|nr:CPBP family glutamic-type intramembrane protease [Planctomycetales bacterium]